MFSNLRIEGGASNHWLVSGRFGEWLGASGTYGPHDAMEIVETNLPELRDMQVNLAPLLPPTTIATLTRLHLAIEFYISPPGWGGGPTEPAFRPFAAARVEVRRRVAAAAARGKDFYVRYRVLNGDGSGSGSSSATRGELREYRRKGGRRTRTSDPELEEPLPVLRSMVHRYRTFDVGYSPCRH